MPTRNEIDATSSLIEELLVERFYPQDGRMRPGGKDSPGGVPWQELTREQQVDALTSQVRWLGFDAGEIVSVSERVMEGESTEFWFDDLAVTDQVERREELFEEWRQDEQAARVRDGLDPPPWRPEFDAMIGAIADPPRFDEPRNSLSDDLSHEERVRMNDDEKVAKHAKWLADEPGGERGNWQGLYIDGDNLRGKDLRRAVFRGTNFHNADLSFADLGGADFSPITYPDGKSPYPTQIRNSLFIGANLEGADLSGGMQALRASFPDANLQGADLRDSGFSHADFARADLHGAKLDNTGFVNVDLYQAQVDQDQLAPARIKSTRLPDGAMHQGTLLEPFRGQSDYEKAIQQAADMATAHQHDRGKEGPER